MAGCLLLAWPAAAHAETFGSDLSQTPTAGCQRVCAAFTKTTSAGTTNRGAPFDGVTTKIRIRHSGPQAPASILILRRTDTPNRFLNAGEVGFELPAAAEPGIVTELSGAVSLQKGDRLALQLRATPRGEVKFAVATGQCLIANVRHAPGAEQAYAECKGDALISADIEPDADTDKEPDSTDVDDDGDTVPDGEDNCPLSPNLGQGDAEKDGLGDPCDMDDDGDGLTDRRETRRTRTDPEDADSDDDGLSDGAERRTNPRRFDTDRDGLGDGLERGVTEPVPNPPGRALGTDTRRFERDRDPATKTNPRNRDTDGDRKRDGREDRNHNGRVDRGETDPAKKRDV